MTQLDTYLPPWLRDLLPDQAPLLVAALTLLAIFLWLRIAALVVGLVRSARRSASGPPPVPGGQGRDCLWTPETRPTPWGRTGWRCASCGRVAATQGPHPPEDCRRSP